MEKTKQFAVFLFVYALAVLAIYYLRLGGSRYLLLVNLINSATPLIPIYVGFFAAKYFGMKTKQGKSVVLITNALLLWWVADIIWWVFAQNATVSISDLFWLSGYALFGLGVFHGIKIVYPNFISQLKMDMVFISLLSAIILLYLLFFPLSWNKNVSVTENIVTSGYVLAGIIQLALIFLLIYLVFMGIYNNSWVIIGVGAVLWWIGDIYYALNYQTYLPGNLSELWWLFAYMMYALGLYALKSNSENVIKIAAR